MVQQQAAGGRQSAPARLVLHQPAAPERATANRNKERPTGPMMAPEPAAELPEDVLEEVLRRLASWQAARPRRVPGGLQGVARRH
jgi:hypothetical protein